MPISRTLGSLIYSLQKDKAATIGFSALGGSYGRNAGSIRTLATAPADSLENRAFAGAEGDRVAVFRPPATRGVG